MTRDPESSELGVLVAAPPDGSQLLTPRAKSRVEIRRALLIILLGLQLTIFLGGASRSFQGGTDFRAFYGAGRLVLDGRGSSLYSHSAQEQIQRLVISPTHKTLPFLYPPFASLLFVPLARLPYNLAFAVFTLISLTALLIASAYLRISHGSFPYAIVPLSILCMVPVLMSLLQGQISLLLLMLYTAAHAGLCRGRAAVPGLLLALALTKWQLALPVLFLLAVWKMWRVVGFAVAGAAGLFCASVGVAGVSGMREYIHNMLQVANRTASDPAGAKALYGMFAADMPNLHGLFFVLTGGRSSGLVFTAVGSVAVLCWAARRKPSIPLALTAAMLVSYHMQGYDLTLLALPLGLAAGDWIRVHRQEFGAREKSALYLSYAAAVMLVAPFSVLILWLHASWILIVPVFAMFWYTSVRDSASNRA
ncbi:MAG TPA: glycosyltransferase family 87 protein [Acidobacteriaceae bacterium]|nr:glycosyltransferase family 87 protein [Acidobacteriaceae bacterium]